jgi:cysteinyl-tRNA synthetase
MSMAALGQSFDVHTGGVDLIFPHHEDEIAQSEAATGETFVQTWLHCAHLQMAGQKMAKSVGNVSRVADILTAGVSPRALRYALIAVPYRTQLAYSDESLAAAAAAIERIDAVLLALHGYHEAVPDDRDLPTALAASRTAFEAALDDDLNTAGALAALFDAIRDINRRIDARSISTADAERATEFLRDLDRVLAIGPDEVAEELPAELAALLADREAARAARNWAESDRLRDVLADRGISVEDTRDGQRWKRIAEVARSQ